VSPGGGSALPYWISNLINHPYRNTRKGNFPDAVYLSFLLIRRQNEGIFPAVNIRIRVSCSPATFNHKRSPFWRFFPVKKILTKEDKPVPVSVY